MADKRAYARLDVGYLTNPKIAGIAATSPTAVLLHIGSICYAAQHLTDGRVPVALILRLTGATAEDEAILRDAGLWEDAGDDRHAIVHDYLEHQRSAAEAKAAGDSGRAAAHARWKSQRGAHAEGNAEGNADRMPDPMRDPMPDPMRGPMPREREREITPTAPRKRGTRIPDDFSPDDISLAWAAREYPWVDVRRATEKFTDYWSSLSGQRAVKIDWLKTWKNWIRGEADRVPLYARQAQPTGTSMWDRPAVRV